jgi:hypothetical protein
MKFTDRPISTNTNVRVLLVMLGLGFGKNTQKEWMIGYEETFLKEF